MSASQIILKLFPIIFLSVFLNTKDALGSSEKNTFVIDDQTKIRFSIPKEKFYYSNVIDESKDIFDVQNLRYLPYSEFTGLQSNKKYVKKLKPKLKDFERRYGKEDGKGVMYAVATQMAKRKYDKEDK